MTVRVITGQGVDACPDGFLALYEHSDYNLPNGGGRILLTDEAIPNLKAHDFNDQVSSVIKKIYNCSITLWTDTNYQGTTFPLQESISEYRTMTDFSKVDVKQNDTISSVQIKKW
ncbi:peptidase inhibitor family I36 protein [Streptomyces sp. NPDC059447]|uniref:peptidase inhibitor family I36 protein n=1 Tax=Streptomyces sp. NPDC059447 TaxID=3346834 RepID=UPI0036A20138